VSLDAIFFDVDDTLFSTSEFAEKARHNSCVAMIEVGLKLELADLMSELSEVVSEFTSNYDHHFDQLLRRIPRRHYKGVNPAILVASAVKAYHDTKASELQPYPDAFDLLRDLSRHEGLVRGVISSGLTIKQAEKLLWLGVYRFLTPTAIYISEQIGINKPNVKLFRRACSDLNLKPPRTMYVGDRLARDIDPANALGMVTVHLKRGGRHATERGETAPTYTIGDFEELREIMIRDFELELPPPRPRAPVEGAPAPAPSAEGADEPADADGPDVEAPSLEGAARSADPRPAGER